MAKGPFSPLERVPRLALSVVLSLALLLVACDSRSEPGEAPPEVPAPGGDATFTTDAWTVIPSGAVLTELDLAAHGDLASMHLENAMGIVGEHAGASEEMTFLMRTRPADSLRAPPWTVGSGGRELVGLYLASGEGPGACLMQLMPSPDALLACCPPGGDGGDDDEEDAPAPDDEEAPELPSPPEEPIILDPEESMRCNAISAIRSLLKLGWIREEDAVEGDMLKGAYVRGFDRYIGERGTNPQQEEQAYRDHLPPGKELREREFHINHLVGAAENSRSWEVADSLLEEGWDCTISYIVYSTGTDGTKRGTGHAEMLTDITRSADGATAAMQDAGYQGTGNGEGIPKAGAPKTASYENSHRTEEGGTDSPVSIRCYNAVDAD